MWARRGLRRHGADGGIRPLPALRTHNDRGRRRGRAQGLGLLDSGSAGLRGLDGLAVRRRLLAALLRFPAVVLRLFDAVFLRLLVEQLAEFLSRRGRPGLRLDGLRFDLGGGLSGLGGRLLFRRRRRR